MNQEKNQSPSLEAEAAYFYQKIFSRRPPQHIVEKYKAANLQLLPESKNGHPNQQIIDNLVKSGADIEAVELAWRFQSRNNILTKKIHILLYLAETTPANFDSFVATKKNRLPAYFILAYHFIRSVFLLVKGKFLFRKYTKV